MQHADDASAISEDEKRPSLGIQSVEIGLGVLEAMVSKGGAVSLSELSRTTGLQPSKLHRYLVSLTRSGMASQSPLTGLYDLGPAARRLGAAAFNRFDSIGLAQDRVTKLAGDLGRTTLLFIWTDQGPTLIRVQNGLRPLTMVFRIGSSLPVRLSAVGNVFMAYLPEALTLPLIAQQQAAGDDVDGGNLRLSSSLPGRLKEIRRQGWYWSASPILPGTDLLAVPVFEGGQQLHSIIAAVIPKREVTEELKADLVGQIMAAARELSAELGVAAKS